MSDLRFRVHDGEGLDADRFEGGMLVGRDGFPVAGKVRVGQRFDGGFLIEATVEEPSVCALSLPVELGEIGRLRVQTTLLPPRREPYPLLYELARHRVKLFLAKAEEWGMWDPDAAPEAISRFEKSRDLLGRASTEAESESMGKLARRSLMVGIDASERLAASHARIHLARKYASKGAPSTAVGLALDPELPTRLLEDRFFEPYGLISIPISWRDLEPAPGRFEWAKLDRWMVAAAKAKRRIVCGPLVDASIRSMPDWALSRRADDAAFREAVYAYCEQVVGRYRGAVSMWIIASGLAGATETVADGDRAIAMTRLASVLVRQLQPTARILVEIVDPFAEHLERHPEGMGPLRYLRRVAEDGIHVDCIGLRIAPEESIRPCRDLAEIASLADRYVSPERHVVVTGLSAPAANASPRDGGWRGAWTPARQAAWLAEAVPVLLARPRFDAVLWGVVKDGGGSTRGLFDEAGKSKPAAAALDSIAKAIRSPRPTLAGGLAAIAPARTAE
jgi:hypothetical protein